MEKGVKLATTYDSLAAWTKMNGNTIFRKKDYNLEKLFREELHVQSSYNEWE